MISNRPLFDAVFKAMVKAIKSDVAPDHVLPSSHPIVRGSDKKYVYDGGRVTYAKLVDCLRVRDGTDGIWDRNTNRFSGRAPDGSAHVGGVYFSMGNAPMCMEMRHYQVKRNLHKALRFKIVLNLKLTHPMHVVDLSMESPTTKTFLATLQKDPAIAKSLDRGKTLQQHVFSNDYSASKAIGLAAGAMGFEGLIFQTARTDLEGTTGNNLVLFGTAGSVVSRKLEIVSAIMFKLRKGPDELEFEKFQIVGRSVVKV